MNRKVAFVTTPSRHSIFTGHVEMTAKKRLNIEMAQADGGGLILQISEGKIQPLERSTVEIGHAGSKFIFRLHTDELQPLAPIEAVVEKVWNLFDRIDDNAQLTGIQLTLKFSHEEISHYTGMPSTCPSCGSTNTIGYGSRKSLTRGTRLRRMCNGCGKVFSVGAVSVESGVSCVISDSIIKTIFDIAAAWINEA